jgi:hypothetical protein
MLGRLDAESMYRIRDRSEDSKGIRAASSRWQLLRVGWEVFLGGRACVDVWAGHGQVAKKRCNG